MADSCPAREERPTLALPMDTRSPAGSAGKNSWVLVLNANTDLSGRQRRMGGWRRFGWNSPDFVNQDLHDQLENDSVPPEPVCPVPTDVKITETARYGDGQVVLTLTHTGEPHTRVRWYKDNVLIFDSNG